MRIKLLIIALLNTTVFFGQPFFIDQPTQSYFKEIQIAKFPDQQKNTAGYVFFISDSSYYNGHIKTKIEDLVKKTSSNLYWYKFKKNKYRYTNYSYSIGSTYYTESLDHKSFDDYTTITILADKNKRYWSWRHFKIKLKFLSKDTIYSAKIYSTNKLKQKDSINSNIILESYNSKIEVTKDSQTYLDYNFQESSYKISYNFIDNRFESNSILNKINFSNPKIEISKGSKNIIFYFPIMF